MSKTVTITGYVYEYDYYGEDDSRRYSFHISGDEAHDYCALVGPAEFRFTIPQSYNRKQSKLAALKKEKELIHAAFHKKLREVDELIDRIGVEIP